MKAKIGRTHIFKFIGGKTDELTDEELDDMGYDGPEDLHHEIVEEDLLTCTKYIRDTATHGWYGEYR